ncbi:hypothetical protein O181_104138 [Austropuccinia psidii MF-1]|uniref:Uncharacterized protein n=1 Tax=Austropuccinia psidii MF-1 TaxID=1389203 RepID=A0A9Q3PJQ0_9BASI|nr:hypothetical protein [Austropuccinia psidii MF-1]
MEDSRTSTSSQMLGRSFDTLIESPEAEITAIPIFRPEQFTTGNNRDIPVSVQKLVYGRKAVGVETSARSLDRSNELISSSEKFMGPKKTTVLLRGWTPMSCKGQVHQIKAWLKNQSILSEDKKKKLAQGKENSTVEAPQASTRSKQGQDIPKQQSDEQEKGKGKGKSQVERALVTELHNYKKREDSHGHCVQYSQSSDGIKKQGGGKNEKIFSKEIDLVKL